MRQDYRTKHLFRVWNYVVYGLPFRFKEDFHSLRPFSEEFVQIISTMVNNALTRVDIK